MPDHDLLRAPRAHAAHPRVRAGGRAPVQEGAHRRLLPSRDRPGGRDRRRRRARCSDDDYLLASYRDHGLALARGVSARGRSWPSCSAASTAAPTAAAARCTCSTSAATSSAAGASSAARCRSRPAWRSPSPRGDASRRCSASWATARRTSARGTSRSTSPASGGLPIVFLVLNNVYGMGTQRRARVGRAGALQARRGVPDARRARRRQRPRGGHRGLRGAARNAPATTRARRPRAHDLPLPRPLGRRRRARLPHEGRDLRAPRRGRPDRAAAAASSSSAGCSTTTASTSSRAQAKER